MPTVDELLNASNEVTTCTVNPDTREIIVPEKYKILGVFSDEKVTKIPFTCPKVVGNNVDLTEYNLYINYENAIGKSNAYLIEDVVVSGDNITFSWLLSRHVTLSPGVVKYSLCAKKLNGDTISNEWNTTIATGLVIQGLEATREIIEDNPDIIETLISKAHTHDNKTTLDKFGETDGNPTYDGEPIGGENVIYIPAKITNQLDDNAYTIETSVTFEQIEAAYKLGQEQILKVVADGSGVESTYMLPLVFVAPSEAYYFGAIFSEQSLLAYVTSTNEWVLETYELTKTSAEDVTYTNQYESWANAKQALDGLTEYLADNSVQIRELAQSAHTHSNKDILDKFGETDGQPTYNGEPISGGTDEDTFYVDLAIEAIEDGRYSASSDITYEQVAEAYAAKKVLIVRVTIPDDATYLLPLFGWGDIGGGMYLFGAFVNGLFAQAVVTSSGWSVEIKPVDSYNIGYSNLLDENLRNVSDALDALISAKHSHDNKTVLDKLSVAGGKLQYDGSDVGLKGDKGDTGAAGADGYTPVRGTDYWTEADKAEIVDDVLAALPTWTGGSY